MDDLFAQRSVFKTVVLLALAGLGAAGCGEASDESLQLTMALSFEPADGTTGHAGGPLAVKVYDVGNYVRDADMRELASRVRLATWPERTLVTTSNDVAPAETANIKQVVLMPSAALEDRWYLIEATNLPRMFETRGTEFRLGIAGTRFRPGSHPRLANVLFCDKGAVENRVYVMLSEPATLPASGVQLTQDGQPVACTVEDVQSRLISLACPTLALSKGVMLSIAAGGTGASGSAFEPGSWAVDIPALPLADCPFFVAPT